MTSMSVLTTRELVQYAPLRPYRRPDPLGRASRATARCARRAGAGVIFGATGGVMEAALRTAHFTLTGRDPEPADAFRVGPQGKESGEIAGSHRRRSLTIAGALSCARRP